MKNHFLSFPLAPSVHQKNIRRSSEEADGDIDGSKRANMAEPLVDTVMLKTKSKILVTVDEALQDIIVVSYAIESKLFQGVLLDSTKRFLPCRLSDNVTPPNVDLKTELSEEDKLFFSVRQRFTYFQEKPVPVNPCHHSKKVTTKAKPQKMTVRLRPRQVLCSKCKSICSENSENVNSHGTRRRRDEAEAPTSPPSRPLFDKQMKSASPTKLCPSFVQRIPRLSQHNEVNSTETLNGSGSLGEPDSIKDCWFNGSKKEDNEVDDKQMVLRKKRSVGSMEDLWDETVFEEAAKKAKTTPVIKISFGSQGGGTVLKIPSKVQQSETESETDDVVPSASETKLGKRKLKKSKKDSKKKVPDDVSSPACQDDPLDPEPADLEEQSFKKKRHKMKHKRKHKSDKIEDNIKEQCLKQKLSINLKRVTSSKCGKLDASSDDGEGGSSQSSEEVPDFPTGEIIIEGATDVQSCTATDGSVVTVGDIVWGKVHGFPWWPGKVLNIVITKESGDNSNWHAQVSWFGSTTSSVMPCDQISPFLPTFEDRYNRQKKTSCYEEAIRQATTAASATHPALPLPEPEPKSLPSQEGDSVACS